ncbi:complement C1q subcomponent subunit C-like [Ptychodera flava]|uniref:complement C1q subcomponent subunit C-like n=1 Tax=Ptychodera flava TaxID=63121 RepID=UPI00396A9298
MKTVITVTAYFILFGNSLFWICSTGDDQSCTHCCDVELANVPGYFSIVRGEKGDTGVPGKDSVIGKPGPKGNRGLDGVKGALGPKGHPGFYGDEGDCGRKGPRGRNGGKGYPGIKGLTGHPGVKGQKGGCCPTPEWSAFSVLRTAPVAASYLSWTVTYDHPLTNVGKDMNLDTGIFTCQSPGVYFFSVSIFKYRNSHSSALLMLNEETFSTIYDDDDDREGMSTHEVYLTLVKGDRVWVKVHSKHVFFPYRDSKHDITFSGYLVHPALS